MECAICLNEMSQGHRVELICNHAFCRTCIFENLHYLEKCPLCRKPLVLKVKTLQIFVNNALYLLIQIISTIIILLGFSIWLILIRYVILCFPNFITFVIGYCACSAVIASALFHIDKVFEINRFEPSYLSIM